MIPIREQNHIYIYVYAQVIPTPLKTPKASPPVMDVVSCSSGGPSPVNNGPSSNPLIPVTSSIASSISVSNGGGSNGSIATPSSGGSSGGSLTITPKIEHSPPEHYERQTVLMWGATTGNSNTPNNNRPTSTTPTSNGLYHSDSAAQHHLKLSNQMTIMSPPGMDEHQSHTQQQLKWNGNAKDMPAVSTVQVYQIHPHQDGSNSVDTSSMYSHMPQSPHHSIGHHGSSSSVDQTAQHHSPQSHHGSGGGLQASNHHAHQQQTIGSSCEVWSPAYSQYQYFTYHHAPQHASTQ